MGHSTTRRHFLGTSLGLTLGAAATTAEARPFAATPLEKPHEALRILHLTDIHIRPEVVAPQRCERLLAAAIAQSGEIDLVLNGGDSIYAADYGDISRERVLEQWKLWDEVVAKPLSPWRMLSALGNHDMWWAAPDKQDPMYGKDYVLKRLHQESRYLSIVEGGWLIVVLDCNNSGLLDEKQLAWLHVQANQHSELPMLIMSHQPICMAQQWIGSGMSQRQHQIVDPLVDKRLSARPVYFLSGHEHVIDTLSYANVSFLCNGAFSGAWWQYELVKPGHYEGNNSVSGTPMGFATIDLNRDGTLINSYVDMTDSQDGKLLEPFA
ncbi:metallophosphoesterase family protein [Bremerella sp. T1]|uniref:metallophosphoesterase family protein n=1 Tax=Bremerella sp. TYQ1 TaxID=3119568 RepID=UPI001CCD14E1|nr:metallophosphoesterase [Bremerella volcania]UBM38458.1 metallophosphoesterase [Bremerella volcania]